MPARSFQLRSFADIMLLGQDFLPEGSLFWLLHRFPEWLFPSWLFEGWRGESGRGRPAWPVHVLMGLLLLRYSETGMSRVASLRRAATDAQWRAALRLPWGTKPPTDRTLRDFEAFLRENHPATGQPRILVVFEHWLRLCLDQGVVGQGPLAVIDSTPMWCYGAVMGTVNLLGEGLRSLAKRWARARKVSGQMVALQWQAPLLLAKSAKGYFADTDWRDPVQRSRVLETLMELVTRCVQTVQSELDTVRENKRLPLNRLCRNLLRVVDEDLETAEDGTIRVVRRQTSQRLISYTDPEAQHFRKSQSKVCHGFKLHVLGDAISGLILALDVTPGGEHDSTQAHPLIARAKSMLDALHEVLGDAAYGGMPVRQQVRDSLDVDILAPPSQSPQTGETLGKAHFAIDFDAMVATCPGGVSTSTWKPGKFDGQPTKAFVWELGSEAHCTCAERCMVHKPRNRKRGKPRPYLRLTMHPNEQELRRARAEWKTPEVQERYRRRGQGERLIREMTRRGARRANAWGLEKAKLQAYCIAAVNNLRLLATELASAIPARAAA